MRVVDMAEYHLKSGVKVRFRPFEQSDVRVCVGMMFGTYKPPSDKWEKHMWMNEMKAFWPEGFASTARKRDYHIAEINGHALGMVGAERFPPAAWRVEDAKRTGAAPDLANLPSPPAAVILDLAVTPQFQGKHIGRLLLIATMLRKIEQGVEHFYAYAPPHALPVFQYAGFDASGGPAKSIMWETAHPLRAHMSVEKKGLLHEALQGIQARQHAQFALAQV